MLTIRQYYLNKLAEECAEVAQRALKQAQFGAYQIQKGTEVKDGVAPPSDEAGLTNAQRLSKELKDLLVIAEILRLMGETTLDEIMFEDNTEFIDYYHQKREKISKYLKLSQELGTVEK